MDKNKALQKLLDGTASEEEIESIKQALVSGEISIGRDVNRSVVIIGSGNKVELTSEALSLLKPESIKEELVEGEPPYMGLRYFDTADAALFFGRATLTRELAERVAKESFLAIVGASGSGKSSVARAGLIPAWKEENERGAIHVITPTEHPVESLAASLTRDSESVTATSTLMDDMQKDVRSLRLYAKKMLSGSREMNLLLVVDQFEETFTLCKNLTERKAFIENLLSLADEEHSAARVVITLRADFYHHCAEYEGLRLALEKHQAYIGAMTQDELREAITAPAETNSWDFQPGLVDLILQDVGTEPGALPLLSHALLETWKRRQGRTLTLQGYHEAGGVKKAIAQTAESVYDGLSLEEQTIARRIFLRLTELGEGVQDTRRRVKLDELSQTKEQEAVTKVLKTLTDARLVTTEQDSAEVAHEALIREWGTLRKWLDEDRESLRLHRHLTESAQEWQRRGREASELYRGARLRQIQEWMKRQRDSLSPLEAEFVKVSQNVKSQERLRWVALAGVGVLLLLTAVLAQMGYFNRFIYHPLQEDFIAIPAGEFVRGSMNGEPDEKPVHTEFLDAFWISRYEVSNIKYVQCVKAGICRGGGLDYLNAAGNILNTLYETEYAFHPVANVSWFQANTYCEWIGARLPTEAEWEKAARGADGFLYPWGEAAADCALANYNNGDKDCVGNTTPVGSYLQGTTKYGVYDMAGNVMEWVNDWYSETYYAYSPWSNPMGPDTGQNRVLRGGSWSSLDVRSTTRFGLNPSYSSYNFGFRCARDSSP